MFTIAPWHLATRSEQHRETGNSAPMFRAFGQWQLLSSCSITPAFHLREAVTSVSMSSSSSPDSSSPVPYYVNET